MNTDRLKRKSLLLRAILDSLEPHNPAVSQLRRELEPLLDLADQQLIQSPKQWHDIPGAYLFCELGLQQYAELERVFAMFRIELIGGESPALRRLKASMGEEPSED
ncbi:hypothetical protein ACIPW4_10180 [Pseudomonas sp. NPDC089996]|uniref:hypothetical protein n=1 Tax=Pseudomonas sp. NPDC089996 TaxID=3364474 RepID=UPI0037F20CDB